MSGEAGRFRRAGPKNQSKRLESDCSEAVREMAAKAREENEALKARLDALEARGLEAGGPAAG